MVEIRDVMERPVVIIGGGGHARVLIDALRALGETILGVVDPKLTPGSAGPFGVPGLGGDDELNRYRPEEVLLVNGIGSVSSLEHRHEVYCRLARRGFHFASVIHPSAIVSEFAALSDGVQVMAGCVIQCGTRVGANSIVNTRASIDHDCQIGESVHIAPGVTLSGSVRVGTCTHIGTGAVVIQEISIGKSCLIAAGAVVHSDLEDGERLTRSRGT